ncbi:helix-turn-helix domain-containing protein, partial [bacterium]|nr:helix-turn-helix domain-containing protein [bacterium]
RQIAPKHLFMDENASIPGFVVPAGEDLPITLREIERMAIFKTLKENNSNRTKTAEMLGISIRTLRNKLREYRTEGIAV